MRHNHIAIALATVAANVFGFLLHAPFSFLDVWAAGIGATIETAPQPTTAAVVLGMVGTIPMLYGLSWLIRRLDVRGGRDGAALGAILTFTLLIPSMVIQYAYVGFGAAASLVDGAHLLATFGFGGFLLGAWRLTPTAVAARDGATAGALPR